MTEVIDLDEPEIITPEHFRSDVWKIFGFPGQNGKITSRETVICRICKGEMKEYTIAHFDCQVIENEREGGEEHVCLSVRASLENTADGRCYIRQQAYRLL